MAFAVEIRMRSARSLPFRYRSNLASSTANVEKMSIDACAMVSPSTLKDVSAKSPHVRAGRLGPAPTRGITSFSVQPPDAKAGQGIEHVAILAGGGPAGEGRAAMLRPQGFDAGRQI